MKEKQLNCLEKLIGDQVAEKNILRDNIITRVWLSKFMKM